MKQQLDFKYNQEKVESSPAVILTQNHFNEEFHSITLELYLVIMLMEVQQGT